MTHRVDGFIGSPAGRSNPQGALLSVRVQKWDTVVWLLGNLRRARGQARPFPVFSARADCSHGPVQTRPYPASQDLVSAGDTQIGPAGANPTFRTGFVGHSSTARLPGHWAHPPAGWRQAFPNGGPVRDQGRRCTGVVACAAKGARLCHRLLLTGQLRGRGVRGGVLG